MATATHRNRLNGSVHRPEIASKNGKSKSKSADKIIRALADKYGQVDDLQKEYGAKLGELEKEIAGLNGSQLQQLNAIVSELAFSVATIGDERTGVSTGTTERSSLQTLQSQEFPKTIRGQIARAQYYSEVDDLLSSLIKVKVDFTMAGLALRAAPPISFSFNNQKEDAVTTFQELLNTLEIDMNLEKLAEDLVRDWFVSDSMILYWRTDVVEDSGKLTPDTSVEGEIPEDSPFKHGIEGILDLCAINPGQVDWVNSLGRDILLIDIPAAVVQEINGAFTEGKKAKKGDQQIINDLRKRGFGIKWINTVRDPKIAEKKVQLTNEDGDYWIIRTRARPGDGLASPSMKNIFISLAQRQMLIDGEFSSAFMMKHFIMLIKQGESITQGPLTGSRRNWLTNKESTALLAKFAIVAKAMRAVVNHTTTIDFVFPPAEMFNKTKFEASEERIHNWSNISKAMIAGDASTYGGGFLTIRKLSGDLTSARRKLWLMFVKFFKHPTIADRINAPEGFLVSLDFNENILKEPKQLLDEIKFLFESNAIDHRVSSAALGHNPEALKASKLQARAENDATQCWEPVNLQAQEADGTGLEGSESRGGRPANPDTTPSESTRSQPPSGRGASD